MHKSLPAIRDESLSVVMEERASAEFVEIVSNVRPLTEADREYLRRRFSRIVDGLSGGPPKSANGQLTLFPLPAELLHSGAAGPAAPAWSRRYMEVARRYEGLDLDRQEAVHAVIDGLEEWLQLVPQRSARADGTPEPANTWGLGAEQGVLRAFTSHLVAIGKPLLADRISAELEALLHTTGELDACCAKQLPGSAEEDRLAATARLQIKSLVNTLSLMRTADGIASQPVGQVVDLTLGPVLKQLVRRQVKADKQSALEDDALIAAWRLHGSTRKAAKALTEAGHPTSKDKVQAAVTRAGGTKALRESMDTPSVARTVASQRHARGRKILERR